MDGSPLAEPIPIEDTRCSGFALIETVGIHSLRFTVYAMHPTVPGERPQERRIVAKLVFEREAVPAGMIEALRMAGVPVLQGEPEAVRH